MNTKKLTENLWQLPGHIEAEINKETGEKREVWKNNSDKIHFRKFDKEGRMMTEWQKIKGKAVEVPVDNYYVAESIDKRLLIDRICTTRKFSDMLVWEVLKTNLSIFTGLAHVKQSEIVEATKLSKGQVSEAMKRLKSPVIFDDGQKLPELVREYEGSERPAGFALNPEVVIIGEHNRARDLWDDAQKQHEAVAEKQVREIIKRINSRIDAGEEECFVLDDELAKIKDAKVKSDVEFELTAALEDDF